MLDYKVNQDTKVYMVNKVVEVLEESLVILDQKDTKDNPVIAEYQVPVVFQEESDLKVKMV
jgi:hypothetical protein